MKKTICTFFAFSTLASLAQSGAKYSTDGNATNPSDKFGTTNNQPLNFVTNNTLRMVLDNTGQLRLVNLSGTGSRFLQTDANGNIVSFPAGSSNEVLFGNGSWGSLPAGATSWQLAANNLIATNTGNVGIGTNNPQFKLDVIGDVRVSNNLYVGGGIVITDKVQATHEVKSMSLRADSIVMDNTKAIYGTTRVYGDVDAKNKMDVQGNATFHGNIINSQFIGTGSRMLFADAYGNLKVAPGGGTQVSSAPCISNALPWYEGGNFSPADQTIGTCSPTDFVLKANSANRIWIKANTGNVGIGTSNPQEFFEVAGNARFGSGNGYVRLGYNSVNSIIDNFGQGAFLFNWYSGGDIGMCVNDGLPNGGGKVRIGKFLSAAEHVEIGTPQFGITNASNVALDMFVHAGKAIKINTYNQGISAFSIANSGLTPTGTYFEILGNGQTQIGNSNGNINTALLSVNVNTQDAFEVFNVANNKVNFKVKANGFIYSREVNVQLTAFPDYVFAKNYKLMSLDVLESYIKENKHLPNVPSAEVIEKEGANLGELSKIQMEKIEELTLYIIELKKEIEILKKKLN